MQVSVSGKQIDVGDALRGHVEDRLATSVNKYFDRAIEAQVVFSRQSHLHRADISVHAGAGILLQSHAELDDIYASFDRAADRIEKQLRRYKRRLRNHHNAREEAERAAHPAQAYVLAAEPEEAAQEPETLAPVIIAETTTEIATLTVGEAVMRMDLADLSAMMFRNDAHGRLNVVYRRGDGNIGWIDPSDGGEDG